MYKCISMRDKRMAWRMNSAYISLYVLAIRQKSIDSLQCAGSKTWECIEYITKKEKYIYISAVYYWYNLKFELSKKEKEKKYP